MPRPQPIQYQCDTCRKTCWERSSHYRRSKTHFCSRKCQGSAYRQIPFHKQSAYRGVRKPGEPKWVYSRRYRIGHPERIAHLKARRYARERSAGGSHSLEEWQALKRRFGFRCGVCKRRLSLTKDHIIPLSKNGTDYITNIQPLCRSCNSRKWQTIQHLREP